MILLASFTRHLVASLSEDHIYLAMSSAASELGIPHDEVKKILKTVLAFREQNSPWPAGFM